MAYTKTYNYANALRTIAKNDQNIIKQIEEMLDIYSKFDDNTDWSEYSNLFDKFIALPINMNLDTIFAVIDGTNYASYETVKYGIKPKYPKIYNLNMFLTGLSCEFWRRESLAAKKSH